MMYLVQRILTGRVRCLYFREDLFRKIASLHGFRCKYAIWEGSRIDEILMTYIIYGAWGGVQRRASCQTSEFLREQFPLSAYDFALCV